MWGAVGGQGREADGDFSCGVYDQQRSVEECLIDVIETSKFPIGVNKPLRDRCSPSRIDGTVCFAGNWLRRQPRDMFRKHV
jgi:hypothetical protein